MEAFPVSAFSDISADLVSEKRSEEFAAALSEMSGRFDGVAMSATVLSPAGSWSGAVGRADNRRGVGIDDQFAIGSVTKTLQAAQVMQLVEAGRLRLDDPADRYLPPSLDFDPNDATIGQLMGMRSGLPDYWPVVEGHGDDATGNESGQPPTCWRWSPPSARRQVRLTSTRTRTTCYSSR